VTTIDEFKAAASAWVTESGQNVWRQERLAYGAPDDSRPLHANWSGSEGEELDLSMCDGERSCGLYIGRDWEPGWNKSSIDDIRSAIADDVRHNNFGDPCAWCRLK
jgi:hypothetical protein